MYVFMYQEPTLRSMICPKFRSKKLPTTGRPDWANFRPMCYSLGNHRNIPHFWAILSQLRLCTNFENSGLDYILGDFWVTNSSGHTGRGPSATGPAAKSSPIFNNGLQPKWLMYHKSNDTKNFLF
jgi:hypothetical protein